MTRFLPVHEKLKPKVQYGIGEQRAQHKPSRREDSLSSETIGLLLVVKMSDGVMDIFSFTLRVLMQVMAFSWPRSISFLAFDDHIIE